MDHLGAVRGSHAGTDLVHHLQLARERQRLAPPDEGPDRFPLDVLHREERLPVEFPVLEDRDDVGMAQAADRLGFLREPLPQRRIVEISADHLDGHRAIQRRIVRQVKSAHPALSETPCHLVLADDRGFRHDSPDYTGSRPRRQIPEGKRVVGEKR
jgi:hypothetical protein